MTCTYGVPHPIKMYSYKYPFTMVYNYVQIVFWKTRVSQCLLESNMKQLAENETIEIFDMVRRVFL